jgi:hypothetical protein
MDREKAVACINLLFNVEVFLNSLVSAERIRSLKGSPCLFLALLSGLFSGLQPFS